MFYSTAVVAVLGFSWSASAASGTGKSKPECVDKCWTNSQYVSMCMGNHRCLCDDAEFQNAVYQCLYSQCSTSKFGTALHHALQACHTSDSPAHQPMLDALPIDLQPMAEPVHVPAPVPVPGPAMLRFEDSLKQRRNLMSASHSNSVPRSTRSGSVSGSAYMTYPTGRARPSQSVSASNYMSAYPTSRARRPMSVSASNYMSAYPTSRARPSQSVSASNYMSAYPTSRARRPMSVSASNYMTNTRSRGRPSQSVSASNYMTNSRSRGRPTQSVTRPAGSVSASNYMSYATSRAKPTMRMVTQIIDGQIQAPTAIVSQIVDGQVQGPAPTYAKRAPEGREI